jgi:hypothetical protein
VSVFVVTVTDVQVEDYRFHRLYSIDVHTARQIWDLLAAQPDMAVRHALLRDLVVTYARPFSQNRLSDMEKYNAAGVLGWRVFRTVPSKLLTTDTIQLLRVLLFST